MSNVHRIAFMGNPNSGKTTIFNALTGLRQKVGNYPGVTVEKKEGIISYDDGSEIVALDLPGTYSLSANSPDERIAVDILLGKISGVMRPDGIVCVIDASNLERNLYLISQLIDQQYPMIIALNMIDIATQAGMIINIKNLSEQLGVRIVPTVGSRAVGIPELKSAMKHAFRVSPIAHAWHLPQQVGEEHRELVNLLLTHGRATEEAAYEATLLLSTPRPLKDFLGEFPEPVLDHVCRDYERLEQLGFDRYSIFTESRYQWIRELCKGTISRGPRKINYTGKIDSLVTHWFWGYVIFFALMTLMFQSIFTWATKPMELIPLS